MRLTNRGRVAAGVLATAVAIAGQAGYSALVDGPAADASARPASAPTTVAPSPSPSSSSTGSTPATRPATRGATAEPTGEPTSVAVMDRGRDDASPKASPTGRPASTRSAGSTGEPTSGSAPTHPPARLADNGRLSTVAGGSAAAGKGPVLRYQVQLEGGIAESGVGFAAAVQRTLSDQRSWGASYAFQRVDTGPVAFTVVLASPILAEQLCKPLEINYTVSCFSGGRAVINLARWRGGAAAYQGALASYRLYVVNHEVGHALGHGHETCRGAGQLAPVMMQQTRGIGACRRNPWVYPGA